MSLDLVTCGGGVNINLTDLRELTYGSNPQAILPGDPWTLLKYMEDFKDFLLM